MGKKGCLFDDVMMRDFIVNGYCVVKADFPHSLHDRIYQKTEEVFEKEGNPGNNLLPRIPEVQKIFDHAAVTGALTSLIGPSYVMHPHRHPHINRALSNGGGWHKDSYWGYRKVRDHHPRWIMAMYYPQDVTIDNGPTGVIPGSHYFESHTPRLPQVEGKAVDPEGVGIPAVGEAGTVLIIHFDLWHRAFPNLTDRTRYMFKFQFTRMDEPDQAYWNRTSDDIPLDGFSDHARAPIWQQVWHWLAGTPEYRKPDPIQPAVLAGALRDDSEEVRLNAAYRLAALGETGLPVLLDGLHDAKPETQRESCYGLGAFGAAALPGLLKALRSENEGARAHAVYAIGDLAERSNEAIPALVPLIDDPSEFVRRNLADTLGQIKGQPALCIPALIRLMKDPDAQVRFNTAYSLAKFGTDAAAAIPLLTDALYDENRYVQGHAAIALEQIGTPEALRVLLHQLQASRWCPFTTKESTF
ncbi:MAG: HEAT repeat domain-containing protein [candidate division Zixibacteria bacterium]|nr:HEAT repeat domain-containing protein [candidate division Zixibacteria bacterium]